MSGLDRTVSDTEHEATSSTDSIVTITKDIVDLSALNGAAASSAKQLTELLEQQFSRVCPSFYDSPVLLSRKPSKVFYCHT